MFSFANFTFSVVVKPEVTVSPRKQTVDVANTVKFRCSASAGFPAATLHWERKDGRRLPRFSKFFRRTGVFKILAASRRDEGEYRCIARNTGGESTMDVLLLVKGRYTVNDNVRVLLCVCFDTYSEMFANI